MTPKEIMDYCLSKNGAYLEYPFGPDVAVVKVGKPEKYAPAGFLRSFLYCVARRPSR